MKWCTVLVSHNLDFRYSSGNLRLSIQHYSSRVIRRGVPCGCHTTTCFLYTHVSDSTLVSAIFSLPFVGRTTVVAGALEISNGRYGTDIGVAVRLPTRHPVPGGLHQEQVSARDCWQRVYLSCVMKTFRVEMGVPSFHVTA